MPRFFATTIIDHGEVNKDTGENERTVFEVDDEVTGLSKAAMKALWEAGALRMQEDKTEVKTSDGATGDASGGRGPVEADA